MLKVRSNIDAFERALTDVSRRQLPFAMSLALNDTARDVKLAEETEMAAVFDRPTPFTRRGVFVTRASKVKQVARIGIKDVQAKYLELQSKGGSRKPKGRALLMPKGIGLNQYGNMGKGAVAKALRAKSAFVASSSDPKTKGLRPGIYHRGAKGARLPRLMVAFTGSANYKKRFEFQPVAARIASEVFPRHLAARMRAALATAR